jgi:hypothetical protein
MRFVSILRCALAFAALATPLALLSVDAHAEGRVALVIGNDHYANLPPDKQLAKAVNDANAIGDALQKIGFTVIRGANLDRQSMVDRIFEFTRTIKPGDTAMMFYAGHGVAISGGNYLLPSDVRIAGVGEESRVRNMAIGEADIVADIQERKAKVAVLVIDACRDNPFRQPGLTRSVGGDQGLTRGQEAEGVFAIYSAGFGQSALDSLGPDDKSPNSVFTRVLAPELGRTDAHLADIVIDVRERVAELAESVHHEQYPAYYDQTRGGRIFLARRSDANAPTVPTVLPPKSSAQAPIQPPPANEPAVATLPPNPAPDTAATPSARVVMYEEDQSNPYGKHRDGSVTWQANVASKQSDIAVTADIAVPDRQMTIRLSFQRNTDKTLPASYLIEIIIKLPPGSELGEVASVPGVLLKTAEDQRGTPLAGQSVKVTSGYFLIGLSSGYADRQRNEALLKERPWFDIPITLANGRRIILAVEKGPAGDRAFHDAFAAWQAKAEH